METARCEDAHLNPSMRNKKNFTDFASTVAVTG